MASYKLIVKNAKVILKTVTNAVLNITGIKDLLTGSGSVDSNTKIDWTLQHYTNTATNFTSTNPILLVGQLGIETDDLLTAPKYKIGDGVTAWNTLPYNSSGGSGLSGLTTNKVLKATSSTTAGNSQITDNGTNGRSTIEVNDFIVESKFLNASVNASVTVHSTQAVMSYTNGTDYSNIAGQAARNYINHSIKNTFSAPLHEFNNSMTKGGVEVATVNDIPSVAGLAPIASPTFTGTPLAPTASANTNNTQIATTAYVDGKSLFRTTTDSSTHTGTLTNTIIWSEDISNKLSSGDIADLISDVVRVSGSTSASIRYYLNSSNSLSGATQIGLYVYGFSGTNIANFRRQLIVKSSTSIRVKGTVSNMLNDLSIFSNYADVTVNLASLYVIFAITLGNTGDQFLVSSRKMVR